MEGGGWKKPTENPALAWPATLCSFGCAFIPLPLILLPEFRMFGVFRVFRG